MQLPWGKTQLKHACNRISARPHNDYVCILWAGVQLVCMQLLFEEATTVYANISPNELCMQWHLGAKHNSNMHETAFSAGPQNDCMHPPFGQGPN